jgi:hypothetical protein
MDMTNENSDNQVLQEDLLGGGEKSFEIPKWLRVSVSILLGIILLSCLLIYGLAIFGCTSLEPSKLGLSNLIIFCILGLCAFLIPWHDYGLKLRKFGPFEFEQILTTQAKEHANEVGELRDRIKLLEERPNVDRATSIQSSPLQTGNNKLHTLLLKFLEYYSVWAFSPSRIVSWGADQKGYEALGDYKSNVVRRELQGMVADGYIETRISKKGNTLYRAML